MEKANTLAPSKKWVLIRSDASSVMGSGHIMRCLSLADELKRRGVEVLFASIKHKGHLAEKVLSRGHHQQWLEPAPFLGEIKNEHQRIFAMDEKKDAQNLLAACKDFSPPLAIVCDHYGIGALWQQKIKTHYTQPLLALDDLADRDQTPDFLSSASEAPNSQAYEGQLKLYEGQLNSCQLLLGASYALLRPFFSELPKGWQVLRPKVEKVFVNFGANDVSKESFKVLEALDYEVFKGLEVHLVTAQDQELYTKACELKLKYIKLKVYMFVENMAELMHECDVAFGAGGVSRFERMAAGLPTIMISTVQNQLPGAATLEKEGVVVHMGFHSKVTAKDIHQCAKELFFDPERLATMRSNGQAMVDGKGAQRLASILLGD